MTIHTLQLWHPNSPHTRFEINAYHVHIQSCLLLIWTTATANSKGLVFAVAPGRFCIDHIRPHLHSANNPREHNWNYTYTNNTWEVTSAKCEAAVKFIEMYVKFLTFQLSSYTATSSPCSRQNVSPGTSLESTKYTLHGPYTPLPSKQRHHHWRCHVSLPYKPRGVDLKRSRVTPYKNQHKKQRAVFSIHTYDTPSGEHYRKSKRYLHTPIIYGRTAFQGRSHQLYHR